MPALIQRSVPNESVVQPSGRSIEEYRKDLEYLVNHESELTGQFPDQWVAIYNEEVAAHSTQRRELSRLIRSKGLPMASMVIQELDDQPMTLIL